MAHIFVGIEQKEDFVLGDDDSEDKVALEKLKKLGEHYTTNNVAVHPAKTQISLCIPPGWSESWQSAFRAIHWADSEDSDQTVQMPKLIWVFAGRLLILLVLSCRVSGCTF